MGGKGGDAIGPRSVGGKGGKGSSIFIDTGDRESQILVVAGKDGKPGVGTNGRLSGEAGSKGTVIIQHTKSPNA